LPETPKKITNESTVGLNKRERFLSKSENRKPENEPSNEMPPMKKKLKVK
jgi:hypothetical protein